MISRTLLFSTLSFLFASAVAQAPTVDPSACQNPAGVNPISPECWTALGISQHVTDWWATNSKTCHPGTPFAHCFLQVINLGTLDCIHITSGSCPPPDWNDFQDRKISVEDFYIAYNIYAMWEFFNNYWKAIGNARGQATDSIGAIVALLDPSKETNGLLNDLLTALATGLSFVAPEVGVLAKAVITGAQQAPNVFKYLYPVGTLDTQVAQFFQISNAMGTVTSYLQANVTSALLEVQNDPTSFLAITGSGAFSINPLPTIPEASESILTALNTYVISQCLKANNWVIARAIDTDMNQLQANGSGAWNVAGCGTGYSSNSICGAYYWNQAIDVSFTLTNNGDLSKDPTPIMGQIFANWTNPDMLFNGAAQCQVQGGSAPVVSTGAAGVSASCLSNVKVCTWDLNPDHIGTQYEFLDCNRQKGFAVDGCTGCPDGTLCVNVPYSYVGNYLTYFGWALPYSFCNQGGKILDGANGIV